MDIDKLKAWAEQLLDISKRNNLINYRNTKTTTVEVLLPSADEVFKRIGGTGYFEVFDPKISEAEDDLNESDPSLLVSPDSTEEKKKWVDKDAYLAKYSRKIKGRNQILLYNESTNPTTVLSNIDKKAREYIEETGVNVAYMAFGFIHWLESDTSNEVFQAPVLLVPIQMKRESIAELYRIIWAEDDIIVNPTFAYKMSAGNLGTLPDYEDEGLHEYLNKVNTIVSKLGWTVTAECKISIFYFSKLNMYLDLMNNAEEILKNRIIRLLLGEPADDENTESVGQDLTTTQNPLIELHSVVDADSSQIEAIEKAKAGEDFVLQGPPGTGKSQTIANIIAELLSDGKKILFVSEKLAALNVVHDKLRQAGLAEFCLELHSHKANRKVVIDDIYHTLRKEGSSVASQADREIAIKDSAQRQLDAYARELHQLRPTIGKSLYQLYEAYAALRATPKVDWTVPQLASKGEEYLRDTVALLEQYVKYIDHPSVGHNYKKNPWYGYINQDTSYATKLEVKQNLTTVVEFMEALVPLQQEVSQKFSIDCKSIEDVRNWQKFFDLAANAQIITPKFLNKAKFSEIKGALKDLQSWASDLYSSRSSLASVFYDDVFDIDGEAYHGSLTREYRFFFTRLFNSSYDQLIKKMRSCKKDGGKLSYSQAVEYARMLSMYQLKCTKFQNYEAPFRDSLGIAYKGADTDWNCAKHEIDTLEALISKGIAVDAFKNLTDFPSQRDTFAYYAEKLENTLALCDEEILQHVAGYFDIYTVYGVPNIDAADDFLVLQKLKACQQDIENLPIWCSFRTLLSELKDRQVASYIDDAICQKLESRYIVNAFKKQFYFQWIDSILSETPILISFNRPAQDLAVSTFGEKDKEQFEINKAKIRAKLSATRPSLKLVAGGSALATLLREGEKRRRQKSIRKLLSETGELVQRIKPCFLMSPLSVSTYLAPNSVKFDVVIFDEASQIFPQDAVGAIYRAQQAIIVGDYQQMPPSNFFNATMGNEDSDDEEDDAKSFESILDLSKSCLEQCCLSWHYRSRYEQLIAFSNKNFYDNGLITFPSSKADKPGIGVDYYYVKGIFDRRTHTNRIEAEYVVDLIYKHIDKYPNRSLGVVAFSVAQQDLIDKLLERKRRDMPEKESFFREEGREPFFIKNLETVQGDERDTIIFSIAYGVDAQGRLLHNFGPLNREGGERRLNVAVTRAKCNVQVVSSMHYTDIDLKRTSSKGAGLLREYLDYAENGSIALERTTSVKSFDQFDSAFELEVCEFLRAKGFTVDTQVGCSGFRIDLGLKLPGTSDYVLAIECDGATYHSSRNARDRDRLRQEILEGMGWKFYRIWSTDWFKNKNVEKDKLLQEAKHAVSTPRQASVKTQGSTFVQTFEDKQQEEQSVFPTYQEANIEELLQHYSKDFTGMVKAILEVEAPLSEEWLLKRTVRWFHKDRVNPTVKKWYNWVTRDYQRNGIFRKDGFLYLDDGKKIQFRSRGSIERAIKYISPDELADGLLEIVKQNNQVGKKELYRLLAEQCGLSRVRQGTIEIMDIALELIADYVNVDGEQISLK